MTILATRFKSLDVDTNVPIADFDKVKESDIYNAAMKAKDDVIKKIENSKLATDLKSLATAKDQTAGDVLRKVTNIFGEVRDLTKNGPRELENLLGSMIGTTGPARSLFNALTNKCKNMAMNKNFGGKPYDISARCGGKNNKAGNSACNTATFGNIIDTLTGGKYGKLVKDWQSIFNTIHNFSSFSYKLNMCGVFGALLNSLDVKGDIVGKLAGVLIGGVAQSKNGRGFLDIVKSSVGSAPLLTYPGGLKDVFENVEFTDMNEREMVETGDAIFESASEVNPEWNLSQYDEIDSIHETPTVSEDVQDTFTAMRYNSSPPWGSDLDGIDLEALDKQPTLAAVAPSANNNWEGNIQRSELSKVKKTTVWDDDEQDYDNWLEGSGPPKVDPALTANLGKSGSEALGRAQEKLLPTKAAEMWSGNKNKTDPWFDDTDDWDPKMSKEDYKKQADAERAALRKEAEESKKNLNEGWSGTTEKFNAEDGSGFSARFNGSNFTITGVQPPENNKLPTDSTSKLENVSTGSSKNPSNVVVPKTKYETGSDFADALSKSGYSVKTIVFPGDPLLNMPMPSKESQLNVRTK